MKRNYLKSNILSSRHKNKQSSKQVISSFNPVQANFQSPVLKGLNNPASIDDKIAYFNAIDQKIRSNKKVSQVDASVVEKMAKSSDF